MQKLEERRVLVTGGSRGLGLGVVEALAAQHANVTVVARDSTRLTELKVRLGISIIPGDATDPMLAESVLRELRPSVLVLNAGATPTMAPLHQQTWESFNKNWDTDVKATFHWIQAALRLPLDPGSRVLISSSGAAIEGSPLSGSYAGAKRMIWMLAGYASGVASDLKLGIRFQALLVRQIVGATDLGRAAAAAYACRKGVSIEAFLAGFGKPLSPRDYGQHVVTLLTDPKYEGATSLGIRGKTGIQPLDA
ncbi:MAG TPA: SDR family oxidoreductase [Bryobacteraceae bacterium]|jgi:NAD(P)-dependent dehydrogenase (short-subunit alcohol dehydrogenase family)|nr:SDR family oxidoreductase [Bryobacteraceae bacterium]